MHARAEGQHRVKLHGYGVHHFRIGPLAQFDFDVHFVHLLDLVHGDAELVHLGKLADDVFHAGRKDVDATHRHHVVGPAQNAALETQGSATAVAAVKIHPHQV